MKGEAHNPEKDAREKTSGLRDLGLIDDERRLTAVGEKLVEISTRGEFKDDNFFAIDKDSYIYLNQLLKLSTREKVRPFIVLIKVLEELDYITEEEFKYLLPLVITEKKAAVIVDNIKKYRTGVVDIDSLIQSVIAEMDNYENALEYFIENNPSAELFKKINMNRKSPQYEAIYYDFFECFVEVYCNKNSKRIVDLYDIVDRLKAGKKYWKKLLFGKTTKKKIIDNPEQYIRQVPINDESTMKKVKEYFFYKTHIFKWKQNLDDYYDLNRRYFKITDIVVFEDSKIQLTTTAKYYFKHCINDFFEYSFCHSDNFTALTTIDEVLGEYAPDMDFVYEDIAAVFDEEFIAPSELNEYINRERLESFNCLIDRKFTDDRLKHYLDCFETRDDEVLYSDITEDADIPTLFEYILGICWYKLSNRKGNILEYMNLSLDANMLPKQHAGGGKADIVYKYNRTDIYPTHTLLLEATLADSTTQRRMEMEPVSRHLMRQREVSANDKDYAILVTTFVHPSVVSDFRGRANTEQTMDSVHYFDGLKIFAISTNIIKELLANKIEYEEIYQILENAHFSKISLRDGWYEKEVKKKLLKTS